MTSIAQSPSEDTYYAGYHIPKLTCVDVNSKSEILFPIEIMSSSSNIDIKDLHVSSIGSGIITDIHITPPTNKSGNSSPELFLSEAPLSKMEITHR
jgi:hypothetical protein